MQQAKKDKLCIFWESLEYGGMNTFIENLINSKKFKKFRIYLVTNRNNSAIKILKKNIKNKYCKIITYSSFNTIKLNNYLLKIIYWSSRPFLFLLSIFQTLLILKKIDPKIFLVTCGGYGNFRTDSISMLSAKFLCISIRVLSIHHSYTKPILWKNYLSFFDKYISKSCTNLVFGSEAVKKNIQKNTCLLKFNRKFNIIHHGVAIKRFNHNKFNLNKIFKKCKNKNLIKIGMLSRIEYNKGHYDLVKAIYKLPDKLKKKFKVYLIGPVDNYNFNKITMILKKLKLEELFKITNYIECDSLKLIKKMDILLSLTKTFEGFGLSIAEALLAKKPVLATNVGAVSEFLNNNNSKLIKPNKVDEIVDSLINFYKNKNKWKNKALNGHRLIKEKFTSDITAQKYIKIFEAN